MRLILAAIVVIIGANIGLNAINSVSNLQDAKLQKYCQVDPDFVSNCAEILSRR